MSLRDRLFRFCVGFFFIYALGVTTCASQAAHGEPLRFPDGKLTILIPQFTAEAASFRAIDESGWDRAGSDEVYAVFSDGTPDDLVTSTYGDVDTGETRTFGPQERCIMPRSRCDHGVSEILHFDVAFFEEDRGLLPGSTFCHGILPGTHAELRGGKCEPYDDLIGRGSVLSSREELLAALPRVGDSVERKLLLGGPCGYQPDQPLCGTGLFTPTGPEYELTYRIRRLPDVELPLNVKPQ
jgi:hypothetical protein